MDQLEQYLESVRRGLDVRSETERDEVVSEIRDHILTLAEKLQQEGVEKDAAIRQAIEQVGDSELVATSISGAHDGASWRQAWLAAIPIVAVAAALPLGLLLFGTPAAWPVFLALLVGVIGGYLYLSPRESGRLWRIPWLGVALQSSYSLAITLGYWLLLAQGVATAGIDRFALALNPRWPADMGKWSATYSQWQAAALIIIVTLILLYYLIKRRQWLLAVLTTFAGISVVYSSFVTVGTANVNLWLILLTLGYPLLYFGLIYTVFIKEWRGDWTMAWSFVVALSVPISTSASGALPFVGLWQETLVTSVAMLTIAGTLAAYVGLPRRFAFWIFIIGGLLYNQLTFMAVFPFRAWWVADKLVFALSFMSSILFFRLVFWLLDRKPLFGQLLYRQSAE